MAAYKPTARRLPSDAGISDDARRMIDFARRWYRFGGGGADDILVDFGVNEEVFFSRLIHLLRTRSVSSEVHAAEALAISTVAHARHSVAVGRALR